MSIRHRDSQWRGLEDTPAPLFRNAAAQKRYIAELSRQGSNPERRNFNHAISLLVTVEQVNEQLLQRRYKLRQSMSEEEWSKCRECFLNKRDFPLQLPSWGLPVLSQYVLQDGDLAMPALEDYARCWPGYYLGRSHRPEKALPDPPAWHMRWPTAIFRGGATGAGVTPESNPRLRLVQLAHSWRLETNECLLDAELTSWNMRQKISSEGIMRIIDVAAMRRCGIESCGRENYMSWEQQSLYKYAIYLPGNVGAGRLGALLGLGFVVLAIEPTGPCLGLWRLLRAGEHYCRLEPDLSNLRSELRRLRNDDAAAFRMSTAARALWKHELARETLEAKTTALLRSLPSPDPERLVRSLAYIWKQCRAAVYMLIDGHGQVRMFIPFANESYSNAWTQPPPSEPAPLQAFLQLVKQNTFEDDHLPWSKWWTNGGLVCNVMPSEVWGESMLPVLQLLMERASRGLSAAS